MSYKLDLFGAEYDNFSIEYKTQVENEVYSLKQIMHIDSFLTAIANSLAVYMIVYCSPPQIGIYRRYLLNIVVSFSDVVFQF
jgi:hypothetical protein